ncbi:MAG: ABC-F family ATP-binding cassette domain-containing protein [bacterium]
MKRCNRWRSRLAEPAALMYTPHGPVLFLEGQGGSALLSLDDISMSFDGKPILEGASLTVKPDDRIALIGENGSGKSTLLKIASGMLEPTSGRVHRQKDMLVGYLPQSGLSYQGQTLWEEILTALPEWVEAQERRTVLLHKISSLTPEHPEYAKSLEQYGEIETSYLHGEGYAQEARLKRILSGLGFGAEEYERPVEEYSAGWQMRVGLAKILAREPDLMLLDEPTAHLDLEAKNWLEGYLREQKAGFVLVSHDRHLLDLLAEKVVEVRNKKLEVYAGNYSKYITEKEKREEKAEELYLQQQDQIRRVESFIAKNRVRKDRARQVQSRIRQLEKLEVREAVRKETAVRLRFPTPGRTPRKILEVLGLDKSYPGKRLFAGLTLAVERLERIAVLGPNGAGKSTLLRILAGQEAFDRGVLFVEEKVSTGWYLQDPYHGLQDHQTVLETLHALVPNETAERLRTFLGAFLFRGEDVFKPRSVLSGGERARLALAALMLRRHHLLLLDEPTNHLDLKSRQALVDALRAYGGTLLFVSHDRYFIQEVATRIIEIREGHVWSFHGTYEDYLLARERGSGRLVLLTEGEPVSRPAGAPDGERREAKQERIQQKEAQKALQRKQQKRKREIRAIEAELEELEREIGSLELEMASPAVATHYLRLRDLHERVEELRGRLKDRYRRWEELVQEDQDDREDARPSPAESQEDG